MAGSGQGRRAAAAARRHHGAGRRHAQPRARVRGPAHGGRRADQAEPAPLRAGRLAARGRADPGRREVPAARGDRPRPHRPLRRGAREAEPAGGGAGGQRARSTARRWACSRAPGRTIGRAASMPIRSARVRSAGGRARYRHDPAAGRRGLRRGLHRRPGRLLSGHQRADPRPPLGARHRPQVASSIWTPSPAGCAGPSAARWPASRATGRWSPGPSSPCCRARRTRPCDGYGEAAALAYDQRDRFALDSVRARPWRCCASSACSPNWSPRPSTIVERTEQQLDRLSAAMAGRRTGRAGQGRPVQRPHDRRPQGARRRRHGQARPLSRRQGRRRGGRDRRRRSTGSAPATAISASAAAPAAATCCSRRPASPAACGSSCVWRSPSNSSCAIR